MALISPLAALKLALVPSFIGLVSVAGKHWGARVAGWLAGLPVVVGPILFLLWVEQGPAFARAAAVYSLAGTTCVIAYCIAYAWLSRRFQWPATLAGAYAVWLVAAVSILALPVNVLGAGLSAVGSLLIAPRVLPMPLAPPLSGGLPRSELAMRMLAGAALTLTVTSLAQLLGGQVSGLLALFPIMSAVLAVFTHRSSGSDAVIVMLRGLAYGVYSLVVFSLTVILMPGNEAGWVFTAAILATVSLQAVLGIYGRKR